MVGRIHCTPMVCSRHFTSGIVRKPYRKASGFKASGFSAAHIFSCRSIPPICPDTRYSLNPATHDSIFTLQFMKWG